MTHKILITGFLLFPMLKMGTVSLHTTTKTLNNQTAKRFFSLPRFNKMPLKTSNFWNTAKEEIAADTTALKQSGWYAAAVSSINAKEYEINYDPKYKIYTSPNRRQNLRAFYTSDRLTLKPREDGKDKWQLALQLNGIYAGKKKLYMPSKNPTISEASNNIRFNNNDQFITEYINSIEGVRQNFIINKKPTGNPEKLSVKLQANKSWVINCVDKKELHFAKTGKNGLEKKITYNGLKVWDADNKQLDAAFVVDKNNIDININTQDAVYPITIDPISSSPNTIISGTATNEQFGRSVASAGDIN